MLKIIREIESLDDRIKFLVAERYYSRNSNYKKDEIQKLKDEKFKLLEILKNYK